MLFLKTLHSFITFKIYQLRIVKSLPISKNIVDTSIISKNVSIFIFLSANQRAEDITTTNNVEKIESFGKILFVIS